MSTTTSKTDGTTGGTTIQVQATGQVGVDRFVCDVQQLEVYHVQDGTLHDQTGLVRRPSNLLELLGVTYALERRGNISRRARDQFAAFIQSNAPWN